MKFNSGGFLALKDFMRCDFSAEIYISQETQLLLHAKARDACVQMQRRG